MKKLKLVLIVLSAMGVVAQANARDSRETVNLLELSDPDFPGGSYSSKIEMDKKVNELTELELTKDHVVKVKDILLNQQRASSSPYNHTAKPVTRSLNVDLSPGLTPPVVRLSSNMLTTIVFTDAAGNPWNIASVALNRNLFSDGSSLQQAGFNPETSKGNNILSIEPLSPVAYGNAAIRLQGLDSPIILMLSTGQSDVDVRVDARIPAINPNRVNNTISTKIKASIDIDDATLLFVDGTPPPDALGLKTTSSEIEAWLFNDEIIVRTKNTILYPSYGSSVTSTNGVTAYKFDPQVGAITISKNGAPLTIYIDKP